MYKAYFINHHGKKRIAVEFPNQTELINRFKKLIGRQWSSTLKVWHLPDTSKYRKMYNLPLRYEEELLPDTITNIETFTHWLKSKRYSENTIKSYTECISVFFSVL